MDIKTVMGVPPNTLEEAIKRSIALLEKNAPEVFNYDEESFVAELHHAFGQHMRNYWGLWSQSSGVYNEINKQFKLEHADDCSAIIMYATYRTKNNLPLDLEPLARRYHLHWKQYENK